MPDQPKKPGPGQPGKPGKHSKPETEWQRRKRLAEAFGDVLPDTTSDERDDRDDGQSSEEWLRRQVPPHHGQ